MRQCNYCPARTGLPLRRWQGSGWTGMIVYHGGRKVREHYGCPRHAARLRESLGKLLDGLGGKTRRVESQPQEGDA